MCRFETSPCVRSKRLRVKIQNARTHGGVFERTHGDVFNPCAKPRYTHTTHTPHRPHTTHHAHTPQTPQPPQRTTTPKHKHAHPTHSQHIHHIPHTNRHTPHTTHHTPHTTRMLGYAHNRQSTVILRRKGECLGMCTAVSRP